VRPEGGWLIGDAMWDGHGYKVEFTRSMHVMSMIEQYTQIDLAHGIPLLKRIVMKIS
jgi:hypothetical protein